MVCFTDWVSRTCWIFSVGRKRRELNLTPGFLVLPLGRVGKNWRGTCLGRKSRVLFDIVILRCLWEMLLFLYFQDMFEWLVLNSHKVFLQSSDSFSCLFPYIPITFRNSNMSDLYFLQARALLVKSLSANVYSWGHTGKDNLLIGRES